MASASTLSSRITFQSQSAARDGYGGNNPTWSDAFTCWAYVKPNKGTLIAVAGAHTFTAVVTYTVTIRFNAKVQTTQRIMVPSYTDGSGTRPARYLTINAGPMDTDNAHAFMTFLCTEVQA